MQITKDATWGINKLLIESLSADQTGQVEKLIDQTVIKAMLQGVDGTLNCPVANQDTAHKIATAIRQKNDALIVNLPILRWSNTKDPNYLTTFDGLNLGFQFGQKA